MSDKGTDLIRPFVLLQFSDLHFGPHSRFAPLEPSRLERLAEDCAASIRQGCKDLKWDEEPSLVFGTGDIAEAARPGEFDAAATFFNALSKSLGLPTSSFVFTPGNHDVSWTACKQIDNDISDGLIPGEQRREHVDAVKLARYENFVRTFYDPLAGKATARTLGPGVANRSVVEIPVTRPLGRGGASAFVCSAYIHDFADLGVSVAALNSCEVESNLAEDHRGHLSDVQVNAVLQHWLAPSTPTDRLRIILVHHNPVTTVPDNVRHSVAELRARADRGDLRAEVVESVVLDLVGFDGRDRLKRLACHTQTSLVLHGHHHASDTDNAWTWRGRGIPSGNTYVFSAGSWGLSGDRLPKDEPAVIQLIRIDPGELTIQAALLRYEPRATVVGRSELGAFVTDELSRDIAASPLSLPKALRGTRASAAPVTLRMWAETAPALVTYRRHKRDSFRRWDLRGTGAPAVAHGRPVDATLDEMYVPLTFYSESDGNVSLTPADIVNGPRSSIVLGSAGSGKTTWMRWTFRRLIENDELAVVPFFLELRTIARLWKETPSDEHTVVNCIKHELSLCSVPDSGRVALTLLEKHDEPTPILLIDGWDELGELGHRFRERLAEFRTAYPRAKIVVTSRPYGSSRPMHSDGFETFEIEPLDDEDIDSLALRFHTFVHGETSQSARESADAFMRALEAAPDAHDLAQTALLLTMMLILAREGPLPDRRHRLYDKCLRNLLAAHPDLGASEGVELEHRQWRPSDSEERIRVVAGLANSLQASGYQEGRAQLAVSWQHATSLLPDTWEREKKDGFLAWLIGRAGVLIDRIDRDDDETESVFVSFAHLSFQEHLAAFHLSISADGVEERTRLLRPIIARPEWWETLRLWAGLIHDRNPNQLSSVLDHFVDDVQSRWLRGAILADGNGAPRDFESWASKLSTAPDLASDLAIACAEAWATSKQGHRRRAVAAAISDAASNVEWMQRARIGQWASIGKLEVAPSVTAVPEPVASSPAALCELKAMLGVSVWFPSGTSALLRLWPTRRISMATTLQICASLGGSREQLVSITKAIAKRTSRDFDTYSSYVDALSADFETVASDEAAADFCREAARELIRCFGLVQIQRKIDRGLLTQLVEDLLNYLRPMFLRPQVMTSDLMEQFVRDLVDEALIRMDSAPFESIHTPLLGAIDGVDATFYRNCVRTDLAALGARCATRIAIAYAPLEPPFDGPTFALLQQACRVSLRPRDRRQRYKLGLELQKPHDEVWAALARRISRTGTAQDLKFLAAVAEGATWAAPDASLLGSFVRGDVSISGQIVTLDELCGAAGVAAPPLIDDFSLDEEDETSADSAPSAWLT